MVKEYSNNLEVQLLKKEKATLESKLFNTQKQQNLLKEHIQNLEEEKTSLANLIKQAEKKGEVLPVQLHDIKLRSNIRDEYEFEEIENLAIDILINGQLQPVLLTKDNYLVAGYRRYYAIELINKNFDKINFPANLKPKKIPGYLVTYKLDRLSNEIDDNEFEEIQYAENNERRSIDNFQMSKLFNNNLDKGLDQKDLVEKFKKTKGIVSSIVAINKIHPQIKKYLKEFQVFAWSKAKFAEENSSPLNETQNQFYHKNKGIIGWKPLYSIAKQENLSAQKKVFVSLYGSRLTQDELNSEFFEEVIREPKEKYHLKFQTALKQTRSLSLLFRNLLKEEELQNSHLIKDLMNNIEKIESSLKKLTKD